MRVLMLLVLTIPLAACRYPGPGTGYDYGMAASAAWIVSTGNNYVCRYRSWGNSPDNHCDDAFVVSCGRA
jgi:hypothetical protein